MVGTGISPRRACLTCGKLSLSVTVLAPAKSCRNEFAGESGAADDAAGNTTRPDSNRMLTLALAAERRSRAAAKGNEEYLLIQNRERVTK
jgi:hypothetical protein